MSIKSWTVKVVSGAAGGTDHKASVNLRVDCEADTIEDVRSLVASAPDLLAALVDAEFLLRKLSINPKEIGAMLDTLNRSAADARAAIARAKGE